MPNAAPGAGPDARAHLASLGLDDPDRFATIRGFPVLDAHEPIRKRVRDPSAATPANPEGLVDVVLEITPEDLARIAANSNAQVAVGRPPPLKIGHTPLEDRPEAWQPKPVGLTSNYSVRERDGRPWLCCDLHYRREHLEEASSYPNISVERVDWSDPRSNRIDAVSLLRRRPERAVPVVPYAAGPTPGPDATLRACYGRDLPAPPAGLTDPLPLPKEKPMALDPEDMAAMQTMFTSVCQPLIDMMTRVLSAQSAGGAAPPADATTADEPPAANYEGGTMGADAGYVPSDEDDKKKTAAMSKACYAAAAKVPTLLEQVARLAGENAALKERLDGLAAGLGEFGEQRKLDLELQAKANYERIIEESVNVEGTIIDGPGRERLLDLVYSVPDPSQRESALRGQLALYAKSSVGQPMIPGQRAAGAAGAESPEYASKRVAWSARRGIFDVAESRRRYAEAVADGKA